MSWQVMGVPVDCLGSEPDAPAFGTELSPGELRRLGAVDRVGGVDHGDLDVRVVGTTRDAETGLVGGVSVRDVVAETRSTVAELLGGGDPVLVLGGCCIPLMGALAGARDAHSDIGLIYVDGHLDLYDHRTSPTGEAADMPTAAVLGIGEPGLLEAMGSPVVAPDRVSLLGARDPDEWPAVGDLASELDLQIISPQSITEDPRTVAESAMERSGGGRGFWVHLDVDVFDESEFPATDYLMPGGLSMGTGRELFSRLGADRAVVGMSVGCYNPEKDPDGRYGRELVELLAVSLGSVP